MNGIVAKHENDIGQVAVGRLDVHHDDPLDYLAMS